MAAGSASTAPRRVNLPNALTLLRLMLVPLFAWTLLSWECCQDSPRWLSAALFLAASATDLLDGHIARRRGQVTSFGIIADPIADKALTGAALIGLSLLGELAWWITIVILVREVGVTLLRFWIMRVGILPAGRGGKAKTAVQMAAITLYLLALPEPFTIIAGIVMLFAVALTVVTGIDYLGQTVRLHRERDAREDAAREDIAQEDAAQEDIA
jgi:CDP-diacylglycerol---glycerol-3-phosphate 3-phosphatidyltransferase